MADKPRVKAPKQRAATADESARRRRVWAIAAAVGGLVLGLVVVGAALGVMGSGGGKVDTPELRTTLQNAGCTLQVAPALEGVHSITDPSKTSPLWNTNPPTSGPHYEVPAVYGSYNEPLNLAQLVHNLEHGGVAIQYGSDVPAATVQQLKAFAQDHPRGAVLAPYPSPGLQSVQRPNTNPLIRPSRPASFRCVNMRSMR